MTATARDLMRAERDMYAVENRIRTMTQWGRPEAGSLNATILASLEAKRNRERPQLDSLRAAVPAEEASRCALVTAAPIRFKPREWLPIGTLRAGDDGIPDLPVFLRRRPAC